MSHVADNILGYMSDDFVRMKFRVARASVPKDRP